MQKLNKRQREVLKELTASKIFSNSYLPGETALTIRYNHRFLEDFDFFELASCIPPKITIELDDNTLIILYKQVKLSFFSCDYPLLNIPEYLKDTSNRYVLE